jgi:hypothetical protein
LELELAFSPNTKKNDNKKYEVIKNNYLPSGLHV